MVLVVTQPTVPGLKATDLAFYLNKIPEKKRFPGQNLIPIWVSL